MLRPRAAHRVPAVLLALCLSALSVVADTGESSPEDTFARQVVEAGRALAAGELQEAEKGFAAARELRPAAPLPFLGLSEVRERQGRWLEALELAREARDRDPEDVNAALAVGRLLVRLGTVDEALEIFAEVRELAPRNLAGYLLAALLLRDQDRPGEAVAILEKGRESGVSGPELARELGLLLLAEGEAERALAVAEEALAEHPARPRLELVAGLALAAMPERRSEAIPRLEAALDGGLERPGRVHLELGTLYLEAGRRDQALENLRRAVELMPANPDAHYRLGNALRVVGDLEAARASLERFQELSRRADAADWGAKELGTELNEIQNLATQNQLPEALERLDKVLEEHPGAAPAWSLKAKVLFSLRRGEEALEAAARARELEPGRVEHHYLEGLFLAQLGQSEAAKTALERALALDRELAPAHVLLAALLARSGQLEEAAAHFEKALELGLDTPDLRSEYAEVLRRLGRTGENP